MAFNFMAAVGGAAKAGKEGIENKREENKAMLIRYTDRADADLKVMRQKRATKLSQITGYVDRAKALGLSPSQSRAVAMSADADKQLVTIKDRRDLNHSVEDIFKGVKYDTKGSNDPATMLPTYKASTPIPVAPDKGFLGAIFAKPDTVEQTKANVRRGLTPDQDARLNGTMINPQGSGVNIQDTNALLAHQIKRKKLSKEASIENGRYNAAFKRLNKMSGTAWGGDISTDDVVTFGSNKSGLGLAHQDFNAAAYNYVRGFDGTPEEALSRLSTLMRNGRTQAGADAITKELSKFTGNYKFVPFINDPADIEPTVKKPKLDKGDSSTSKPDVNAALKPDVLKNQADVDKIATLLDNAIATGKRQSVIDALKGALKRARARGGV